MLKSRLSANTMMLLLSNGGSAILAFLLSVIIGRTLGETALGVYTTSLAWILPLALVADFGVGTLITRDVAQFPEKSTTYLTQSLITVMIFGVGLCGLLMLSASILSTNTDIIHGIQLSAPLVLIMPLFGVFTAVFRAHRVMYPIALLNIGMLVFQVPITAFIFAGDGTILSALAINTLTSLGQLMCAWWVWRRLIYQPTESQVSVDLSKLRKSLRQAFPFAVAGILGAVQIRVGIILLEQLADVAEVGFYSVASRFVEAMRIFPNALFGALLPTLSALSGQSARRERLFRWVMIGLAGFGLLAGLVMTLMSAWVVDISYGEQFAPSVDILILAIWGLVPALLRAGRILYWYALGQEHFVNMTTLITIVCQVGLCIWLIPQHGAMGLAGALIITETIGLLLLWRPFTLIRWQKEVTPHVSTH